MRTSLAALLLLAGSSSAAWADKSPEIDLSTLSDDQLIHSVQQTAAMPFADPCNNAIPIYTEFDRRHPNTVPVLRALAFARTMCADNRGAPAEALTYFHEFEDKYETPGLDGLAIYLAHQASDGSLALARLSSLWRNGALALENKDVLALAVQTVKQAGMDDELDALGLEITSSPKFSTLSRDQQELFAGPALRAAAIAGDIKDVEALLPLEKSPRDYVDMLEWREYAKAWPAIERAGGDHLITIADRYVAESRSRYAEKLSDRDRFADLARALYFGGLFAETEALVGNWRRSQASLDKIAEGDAWAMNIEAYALDALGRRAEADAVFDRLATYDPNTYAWEVSFAINRASRIVGQGRTVEGLAAVELARPIAAKHGSTYAKMLVARDRTCSLYRLGRPVEAAADLDFLRQNYKETIESTVQALLCARRDDEAKALLSKALDDKALRYGALSGFAGPEYEFFYTPSDLPSVRNFIATDPDLQRKALLLVREIPARFVPQASLERSKLAKP